MSQDERQAEGVYSSDEHMKDMLLFLDMLLYVAFQRKKGNDNENLSMRGLVITEKEIEQAFALPFDDERLSGDMEEDIWLLVEEIMDSQEEGEFLPFLFICKSFGLSPLERFALLVGAAPLYHRKYERIYGYLQDQVNQSMPTRGLCISLASLMGDVSNDAADFLSGTGKIEILFSNKEGTGLSGTFKLRPRVQNFLLGLMEMEPGLSERAEYYRHLEAPLPMVVRRDKLEELCNLFDSAMRLSGEKTCMIMLYGREGIGRHFLLRHLAVRMDLHLLFLDLTHILYEKWETVQKLLEAAFLETVLGDAYLCLWGCDLEREGEEGSSNRKDCRREVFCYLEEHVTCFFLLAREKEEQISDFKGNKVCFELSSLTAREKISLWETYGQGYPLGEDVDLKLNGNKYILTPKGIQDALATAQLLAGKKGREIICQEDIRQAVKQNQKNQLGAYATLINSRFVWDDLVLGEEQKRQMRMVCDQMKYRDIVEEKWGFHSKTPYGRGLSVLFYGPPGTGKTMAAQVMANELGLDLYRIDISQMVSKYIGETQKNISQLFQKAKDINALLFFDEADSLFARRSEAKDSHDRNANAETAHLLQKLEDYEGITVLATNYLNNIDDAFKRRIKFIIHIAFPEALVRLKLWRSILPEAVCCEEELDLDFFAEHFELSGSSIKEILTNAAYLAAAEHRGLANRDLVEAVKLNFAKYGKVLTKNDFGYLG